MTGHFRRLEFEELVVYLATLRRMYAVSLSSVVSTEQQAEASRNTSLLL